ncbi:MAG: App1 family protein [bacterium]|nr:App1 family protein [bacterium]
MKQLRESYSDLKPDHQATLFPSLGYYDARKGCCRAFVHGRVFIDGKVPISTRILLHGLKHAMKASPEEFASETFQQRIDGFLAAPGRRRRIVLQVGNQHFRLRRRTRRNGTFYGSLKLPEAVAREALADRKAAAIPMRLRRSVDSTGTIAASSGIIHFTPPQGLSVISDIDDTIKNTVATSRTEMLANTFLRPFALVDGMAELYQSWSAAGCDFHYVSSSPWQLYEPLAELCMASNFPPGSMHLRYFRVRDQMFKRFRMVRRNTKVGIIANILNRLPERRFVLVGDSGEKDPEIYTFLAKRFPRNVAAVLIRNLAERPMAGKRLTNLMSVTRGSSSPHTHVRLFEKASEIEDVIAGCETR